MQPLKPLATLAFAAVFLPSAAFAERTSFKVCFTNKAWIVWEYAIETWYDVATGSGGQISRNNLDTRSYSYLLGQSGCLPVYSDRLNPRFVVKSNYGEVLDIGHRSSDFTIRMDGTVFNSRMTILDGVRLD